LLVGVALHELTHAMGRVPYGPAPDILDLFRFTSPGVHLFSGADTAPAAYFSLDGGATKLADYGRTSDPSDFLNGGVQGSNDPFNEFYSGGTIQSLSAADKAQLDALGFHTMTPVTQTAPVTTVIESFGSISLVQVGSNYFFNPGPGVTGTELKYAGAAVVAAQFGGYAPIGVEATATGFEVAWKVAGVDQYSVWATDSNGNYTSNLYMPGSGTSASLEAIETSFHQDLNGDGTIGLPTTVIESFGSTSLVQVSSNYFFNPGPGVTGTELKYGGPAVVAGQFGGYAPLGVEATATGFEVAWKVAGVDQYSVWATDSNGNYTSNLYMPGSGTSASLEAIETSFHQDLNGDGEMGVPTETQAAPVVIANNDVFHFNFNSPIVADLGHAAAESDGFAVPPRNSELEAILHDPVAAFHWTNDAHDPISGNPDQSILKHAQIADLHANAVFIH
jgi:serralysin